MSCSKIKIDKRAKTRFLAEAVACEYNSPYDGYEPTNTTCCSCGVCNDNVDPGNEYCDECYDFVSRGKIPPKCIDPAFLK